VSDEVDGLAEKIVSYFGPGAVEPLGIEALTMRALRKYYGKSGDIPFRALMLEEKLQVILKELYEAIKGSGEMTLGLDDFIMALANAHETNIYLLKQRNADVNTQSLRSKVIKLAHAHPEFRGDLLPILKTAMEFKTQEAMDEYLKAHPKAKPENHSVAFNHDEHHKSDTYKNERKNGYYPQKAPPGLKVPPEVKAMPKHLQDAMEKMPDADLDKDKAYRHPAVKALQKDLVKRMKSGEKDKVQKEFHAVDDIKSDLVKKQMSAKTDEEADQYRFPMRKMYQVWRAYNAAMSDMDVPFQGQKRASLRSQIIKLAHSHPEFRGDLLPLIKEASGQYMLTKDLPQGIRNVLKEVDYGRRDIRVIPSNTYSPVDPGGEGRRGFTAVVDLGTGRYKLEWGSWGGANMFNPKNQVDLDDKNYPIPMNGAVVKGFIGGTPYASVYVNPDNLQKLLPSETQVELSEDEKKALKIIKSYKAGSRGEAFGREGLGKYDPKNPIIVKLLGEGLVKLTGVGLQITLSGKNMAENLTGIYV